MFLYKTKIKEKIFLLLLCVNCFAVQVQASNTDTLYINPNPCDSVTTIYFTISETDTVSLDILDVTGQSKKNFFTNSILSSGSYSVNYITDSLTSGIYFVRLKINSIAKVVKLAKTISVAVKEDSSFSPNIKVFPNPTDQNLNFELNLDREEIISFSLYDAASNLVKETLPEKVSECNNYKLDTSDISEGTYLLVIKVGCKQQSHHKVIKR
jgi:hypothetical protein